MFLPQWLRQLAHRWSLPGDRRSVSLPRRTRKLTRPFLEHLEDRLAPATLTVNTTADVVNPSDGTLSLRDAIAAINAGNANGLTSGEKTQVSGTFGSNDTIQFDATSLSGKTITLNGSALPRITHSVAIVGLGAGNLAISGNNQSSVFTIWPRARVSITGLTIENGKGSFGGGIANTSGTLSVSGCIISGNSASRHGGGLFTFDGALTINNSTIANNSATFGGGIQNEGSTLIMNNSTLTGNSASGGGAGGGINNQPGFIFGGNSAGSATLNNCIITDNSSPNGNSGGLANYGTKMTVNNCTLSGNSAGGGGGGGIANATSATLTVDNCTFAGNSAKYGGGLFNYASKLTVSDSTLADNSAVSVGGGIANVLGGSVKLNNTIVANSTSGGELYLDSGKGSTYSGSNDLIGDGSDLGSFSNSLSGDPRLAPLGNYGGPLVGAPGNQQVLPTMALYAGSPALNAGSVALAVDANGNPLTTDERGPGFPRVLNNTVDIGAFEGSVAPATLIVNSTDDNTTDTNVLTLREAIALVDSGGDPTALGQSSMPSGWAAQISGVFGNYDTIEFDAGLSGQTITLSGSALPALSQNVTITGLGASNLAVSGNNQSQIFQVNSGATVNMTGLTLEYGSAGNGGAINNAGNLTIGNSTLSNNTASSGAGGAIYNTGSLTISNSTFSNNTAEGTTQQGDGGAIINFGSAAISGSTFTINKSTGARGGALANFGNSMTLSDSTLSDNKAAGNGGGIYTLTTLTVSNCTISGNSTSVGWGGGILNNGHGKVTVSNSTIADNSSAGLGGGLFNNGTMTVSNSLLTGNTASGSGGGIYNDNVMSISNSMLSGNSATSAGGGVANTGALTLSGSTFSGNSANYGGGILNGGITAISSGSVHANNCTFSGNSANYGGGIFTNNFSGALTITNSTFAGNSAVHQGGGIDHVDAGSDKLNNTIVANSTSGGDLSGSFTGSNDLIGDGSDLSSFSNSLSGDPRLAPLGNYGGPLVGAPGNQQVLPTMALYAGSPALNAGSVALAVDANGNPLTTDERGPGFPRVVNNTVDIGAFEGSVAPATLIVNSTDDNTTDTNVLTLREAIALVDSGGDPTILGQSSMPSGWAAQISGVFGNYDTIEFALANGSVITLNGSALPAISQNVTITGLGAGNLAISGNNQSTVFTIAAGAQVSISGLTIEDGNAGSGFGGGIYNTGTLTLSNDTLTGNSAVGAGGGIYNFHGNLMVSNCTISGNSANHFGGGISTNRGTLTVSDSTFADNSSAFFGGGLLNLDLSTLSVTVSNCLFTDNTAAVSGGGIYNFDTISISNSIFSGNKATSGGGGAVANTGLAILSGSTFSGNSATYGGGILNGGTTHPTTGGLLANDCTFSGNSASYGGGLYTNSYPGLLTINDSTFAGNSATNQGGGIDHVDANSFTLNNDIVAKSTSGGDLYGGGFIGSNNLIGDGSDLGSFSNSLQGDPLLALLGNYGGPLAGASSSQQAVQTMALLPGSPAIDAGNNALIPSGVTTDQRGQPRIVNGTVDIGAFESQGFSIAVASGNYQSTGLNANFPDALTVTVTPNNPLEPVNGGVVTFTAPNTGASATFSTTSAVISNGSAAVTATANGTAGSYTVTASASGASTPASFSLTNAVGTATLIVNSTADSTSSATPGLTLREAILLVNNGGDAQAALGRDLTASEASQISGVFGNADTIEFALANGSVITLNGSALPAISQNVTITGLGAGNLAISGNKQSGIFTIDAVASVTISGVTIEDGNAGSGSGGGIYNSGSLTLSNALLSGNSAQSGGGIYNYGGALTLNNSTFLSNSAAGNGGGIVNTLSGTLTANNCTFAGNSANSGGGIYNYGSALTLSNSTFSANSATANGGGIACYSTSATLTVTNCTFAGNSAQSGGGIYNNASALTINDSTFAGNSATSQGGGIANEGSGTALLNNTLVAGSTSGGDLYLDSASNSTFLGSNDLIGDGSDLGSFTNSLQGNPLLASLGNYGGSTETIALLPGSPAIDAGNNALIPSGVTTDQRGQPRIVGSAVDIGAFESQGFTLTASSGRVQTTDINTNFPNALTVTVTANNPLEPVNGGVVTFTAPNTGASATLSASTAVISNGTAFVTATANGTAGSYTVAASASGASTPASFYLTNAVGPTSRVGTLSKTQTSDTFTVPVTFSDPAGVASVDLYDSSNGGKTWKLYQNLSATGATSGTLNFSFTGQDRNIYDFYSIAHSVTGVVQSPPNPLIEASTDVPDLNPPVTHALAANPSYSWAPFPAAEFSGFAASSYNSSIGIFTITWAGADPDQKSGNPLGSIATIAVFVSVDGGAYQQIGAAQSAGKPNAKGVYSGSLTYNALADGQPHSYSFYSLGTDDLGNTQAVPSTSDVAFSNISYTAPLAVTALNVVQNETLTTPLTERSYIRYLEVSFNQSPTTGSVSNFLNNVELLYFGTNGVMQGTVSLSNVAATLNGTNLFLDFGANGITSALTLTGGQTAPNNPTSNVFGDGWYALGVSKNATGTGNPIWVPFFRLLGSASGDTIVTGTATGADYKLVSGAVGKAYNPNADLNGDGSVNLNDVKLVKTSNTHTAGTAPTSFPQFQLFAGPAGPGQAAPQTETQLKALLPQAIAAWQAAGLDAADVQLMKHAQVQVADLSGNILGLEQGNDIWINDTASGYGWYVGGSVAANEVDLLTVLEHELGHIVGLADNSLSGDLMNTSLGLGVRRTPTVQDVARITANANTAQISMGTAANSGIEAESLALRDFLFTLLGNLVTLDHDLISYTYPLRYPVSDAS